MISARSIFAGLTAPGLLFALLAQVLFLGAAARLGRLSPRAAGRLGACLLWADLGVALAMIAIGLVMRHLNQGSHERRALVILAHLALVTLVPWMIWTIAISSALGRRAVWSGAMVLVLTVSALILPGLRLATSRRPARVTHITIPLPRLPKALDGLKIILISDTHLGPITLPVAWDRLLPLRHLKADMVVFAGDLATGGSFEIPAATSLLDEMAPRATRLAVLGNHDRWTNERLAVQELRAHGFTTLVNESRRLRLRGAGIWMVGVNDLSTHADRLEQAFTDVPENAFVILLSHDPDIIAKPLARRADLILSGHTHGGQVVLPLVGPLACNSNRGPRYASGLFTFGSTKLFVTRGLGEVVVPFRICCDPEIAVLELRSAG
jgi:hypothetical protein